jgi:transposase
MYSNYTKNSVINIYNELKNYNIIGQRRKDFITTTFNIHINSVYNWINTRYAVKNLRKKYKNIKITSTIEHFILNGINNNPIINIKTIKKNILMNFNISLSVSSIYYVIKNNNLTYKKTHVITNPYSIVEQKEQLKTVYNVIKHLNQNNIVSIDEKSIVTSQNPSHGWAKKGKKCILYNNSNKIINKHYTTVVATTNKKILNFATVDKGLKTDNFLKFIKKIHISDRENKYTYLIDNASIHRTKKFMDYVRKNKLHVLYNVPYHSETNPIERVFSVLKNEINRNPNDTIEDIIKTILNVKNTITETTLMNIFNHSFSLYLNNDL